LNIFKDVGQLRQNALLPLWMQVQIYFINQYNSGRCKDIVGIRVSTAKT